MPLSETDRLLNDEEPLLGQIHDGVSRLKQQALLMTEEVDSHSVLLDKISQDSAKTKGIDVASFVL